MTYRLQLETLSPAIIASSEGFGSLIDTDIVYDDYGLPYIPARRIKGVLKESAIEICEMMQKSKLIPEIDMQLINKIFGNAGDIEGAAIIFENLYLQEYEECLKWIKWAIERFDNITPEIVLDTLTEIRQQTSIDDQGLAEDGSLRTSRALIKGLLFEGNIMVKSICENTEMVLALSCVNLKRVGTMRNRGFGQVKCQLYKGDKNVTSVKLKELEGLLNA